MPCPKAICRGVGINTCVRGACSSGHRDVFVHERREHRHRIERIHERHPARRFERGATRQRAGAPRATAATSTLRSREHWAGRRPFSAHSPCGARLTSCPIQPPRMAPGESVLLDTQWVRSDSLCAGPGWAPCNLGMHGQSRFLACWAGRCSVESGSMLLLLRTNIRGHVVWVAGIRPDERVNVRKIQNSC